MKTAGRRVALCIVFSLLGSAALAGVAAAATKPSAAAVRTYVVDGVRTSLDRSAVVATGAAIIEVDHAAVTVTASRSDVRKLRSLRYRVTRYVAPRERTAAKSKTSKGLQARAAAFPAADSGYHTYQEVIDDTAAIVAANPSIVSRSAIGTSYGGRTIYALKISDNVGARRGRAGGPVHGQPARARAPDRRDGDLPAQGADGEVFDRRADQGPRRLARDLGHPAGQPRRRRVRRRDRLLRAVAQEPPAEHGLVGDRHRPEPQLGVAVGLLRRLERHDLVGDLPRPVVVLGQGDAGRARLRPDAGASAAFSRSRRTSTGTRTPS